MGWAVAWNKRGLYHTQNGLVPCRTYPAGLAQVFVQRRALCRATDSTSYVRWLTVPGWATGAALNFVDIRSKELLNVEILGSNSSVLRVQKNYSHVNLIKHANMIDLPAAQPLGWVLAASAARQAAADSFPAPQSAEDIRRILSDSTISNPTAKGAEAIFNPGTLGTFIVSGNGTLQIWANATSLSGPPVYEIEISKEFFDS